MAQPLIRIIHLTIPVAVANLRPDRRRACLRVSIRLELGQINSLQRVNGHSGALFLCLHGILDCVERRQPGFDVNPAKIGTAVGIMKRA